MGRFVIFWPVESMTNGLNTLPLFIITVFSVSLFAPAGLGTTRGSMLGFGSRALNSVVLGTANGTTLGGRSGT